MSAPTTLLEFYHAREVIGYCHAGAQDMVLGITVDLSALPYFLRPFPGPHRAGVPDRLVLVGSDCASRRGAVGRGQRFPSWRSGPESEVAFWPGLPVQETVQRQARDRSERSGQRGGPESEASVVPPRPGLPVRDWIVLLACLSRYLGRPMSYVWLAMLSVGPSFC